MVTREFSREWDEVNSHINHRIEQNVLFDFFDYLQALEKDLKAIKKGYEKEFNKLSTKPLKYYIDKFNKRVEQYRTICIENHKQTKSVGHMQSLEDFNMDIIQVNGKHYKINDKYYPVLKRIAESIFKIEDDMSGIVEKFWQQKITYIKDYDMNKDYFLLAHAVVNNLYFEEKSKEYEKYLNGQNGICFSVVTNKKTRLYAGATKNYNYYSYPRGTYGIIARPKDHSMLGTSYDDMLSTEFVNGKCEQNRYFRHSDINKCYDEKGSKIYCHGTKICPPNEIFNIDVDTINEIILDKSKIDVEAVFYVESQHHEKPKHFEEYKKIQEKIWGHELKTIKLNPRNMLKQINLDEIYDNF